MNRHLQQRGVYDPQPDYLPRPPYYERHRGPKSRAGLIASTVLTGAAVIFLVAAIVLGSHP